MSDIKVRLTRFVHFENEGALQAFCDIALGDLLLIKGVRVVEGRTGPFVTMPRQLSGSGKWYDNVVFLSQEIKDEVERMVLAAYNVSRRAGPFVCPSPNLSVENENASSHNPD